MQNNEDIRQKILNFKPNTKFILLENYGYDIYPFYKVIQSVNISNYDYVLKLHTKSYRTGLINGLYYKNYDWRNFLVTSLIGSKNIFKKNIRLLEQKPKIGLIGNNKLCLKLEDEAYQNKEQTEKIIKQYNLTKDNAYFIAGTMFLVKADLLHIFKEMHFTKENFLANLKNKIGDVGTLAHSLESILGVIITSQGYKIQGVNYFPVSFFVLLRNLVHNNFSIKNEYRTNGKKYKVLTILGIKMKFRIHNI